MKNIHIQPFPNFRITDEAFENDVKGDLGVENAKKSKIPNDILVTVNEYKNGERRVNFVVPDKKNGKTFLAVFPDPIQLYYFQAINQFKISEELRDEHFINASRKIKGKEGYFLNSDSDKTHPLYNNYLQSRLGSIIMLTCSVEAFVNSTIPENIKYISEKGEYLDKFGIQRWLSLKEKIEKVIPIITNIDFMYTHRDLINKINALNQVRNEFVHLKNYNASPFSDDYHKLFKNMQILILKNISFLCELI